MLHGLLSLRRTKTPVAFGGHDRTRLLCASRQLDYVEGLDDGYRWIIDRYDLRKYTARHFSKSIEECLEMFANTLFLTTFLYHFMKRSRGVRVQFT